MLFIKEDKQELSVNCTYFNKIDNEMETTKVIFLTFLSKFFAF